MNLSPTLTHYIQEDRERFYRIAYSYLREREAALDVVQNAILTALKKSHTLREERYLRTWFYRILVNESLGELRRRKRSGVHVELDLLELTAPAGKPGERPDIYELLRTLPEEQQTVVILRYFEELKLDEISRITKWNISTVKTRLYAALKELRRKVAYEIA